MKCPLSIISIYLLFVCSLPVHSQDKDSLKPHRILFLLNGSGTMANGWQGQVSKHKLAAQLITGIAEEMYRHNDNIQFALRVYGHLLPPNMNICNDSRREVPFSKENYGQLQARLEDIQPQGKGSLGFAFSGAIKNELSDTGKYQYSIIVIADTVKLCDMQNCLPAGTSQKLYRKYLVEFGKQTSGCYDSVFSGDVAGYRGIIDFVLSQYPAKEKEQPGQYGNGNKVLPLPGAVKPDTIIVKGVMPAAVRQDTTALGTAVIYNTDQLHTIILFAEENGKFERIDEIFFSGAASKTISLKPGNYKASMFINGAEHSQRFQVGQGSVTHVFVR